MSADEIILQILLKLIEKDPAVQTNPAFSANGKISPEKVAEAFVTIKTTIAEGLKKAHPQP